MKKWEEQMAKWNQKLATENLEKDNSLKNNNSQFNKKLNLVIFWMTAIGSFFLLNQTKSKTNENINSVD